MRAQPSSKSETLQKRCGADACKYRNRLIMRSTLTAYEKSEATTSKRKTFLCRSDTTNNCQYFSIFRRGMTTIGGLVKRPNDFFERRLSDGKIFDFPGRVYPFEGVFYGFGGRRDFNDEKVPFAAFEFAGFRDEFAVR